MKQNKKVKNKIVEKAKPPATLKLEKLVPNNSIFNKPCAYYKEYMSYINAYNKALEENKN